MAEAIIKDGVHYGLDGNIFCDRCGHRPIINGKCRKCDVTLSDADQELAEKLESHCFHESRARQPGFSDGRPESFDVDLAARIIAASR